MRRIRQAWPLALGILLSAGCAKEADRGFCSAHGQSHWAHRNQVGALAIRYAGNGDLSGELSLPAAQVDSAGAGSVLAEAGRVFDTAADCVAEPPSITRGGGRVAARYRLHCAGGEPLAHLSVPLFDSLENLEELEVTMSTPAVTKHFLVHRRCERAIFNVARNDRSRAGKGAL